MKVVRSPNAGLFLFVLRVAGYRDVIAILSFVFGNCFVRGFDAILWSLCIYVFIVQ